MFGISGLIADNAKLVTNKVNKLTNLQVMFLAGTSEDAPEMKRLIEIFKQNVERDYGTFLKSKQVEFYDGKREISNFR
jgi:hypothetical protein